MCAVLHLRSLGCGRGSESHQRLQNRCVAHLGCQVHRGRALLLVSTRPVWRPARLWPLLAPAQFWRLQALRCAADSRQRQHARPVRPYATVPCPTMRQLGRAVERAHHHELGRGCAGHDQPQDDGDVSKGRRHVQGGRVLRSQWSVVSCRARHSQCWRRAPGAESPVFRARRRWRPQALSTPLCP